MTGRGNPGLWGEKKGGKEGVCEQMGDGAFRFDGDSLVEGAKTIFVG
jgi:hypothetical protein